MIKCRYRAALIIFYSLVVIFSFVLVSRFVPYIVDYDGISYLNSSKLLNGMLFGEEGYYQKYRLISILLPFLPITNALSVALAAPFLDLMGKNYIPIAINALYLFLFMAYLRHLRGAYFALIAAFFICANILFFRLITSFISEFPVGLWLFSFLATLFISHPYRKIYLPILVFIGVFIRNIDLVLVASATASYVLVYYALFRDGKEVIHTAGYVFGGVLATVPFFYQHYLGVFDYVTGDAIKVSISSWKALGGVSGGWDVPIRYGEYLFYYNPLILLVVGLIFTFMLVSRGVALKHNLAVLLVSIGTILPLGFGASLNIMVVFWVFSTLMFVLCETGAGAYQEVQRIFPRIQGAHGLVKLGMALIGGLICLLSLHFSWNLEVKNLKFQKEISEISFSIASVMKKEPGTPVYASNYYGLGALDQYGLSWNRLDNFVYGNVEDVFTKKRNPVDYLNFRQPVNFYIAARENYFFPPWFGVNDHISDISRLFARVAPELGFVKASDVIRNGRIFEIWYRPGTYAHLQYEAHDNWIGKRLPISIGNPALCKTHKANGTMTLSVDIPMVKNSNYMTPFVVNLVGMDSTDILASATVNQFGRVEIDFELQNLNCGLHYIQFDKTFSTELDRRKLSAQFVKLTSALRLH